MRDTKCQERNKHTPRFPIKQPKTCGRAARAAPGGSQQIPAASGTSLIPLTKPDLNPRQSLLFSSSLVPPLPLSIPIPYPGSAAPRGLLMELPKEISWDAPSPLQSPSCLGSAGEPLPVLDNLGLSKWRKVKIAKTLSTTALLSSVDIVHVCQQGQKMT